MVAPSPLPAPSAIANLPISQRHRIILTGIACLSLFSFAMTGDMGYRWLVECVRS